MVDPKRSDDKRVFIKTSTTTLQVPRSKIEALGIGRRARPGTGKRHRAHRAISARCHPRVGPGGSGDIGVLNTVKDKLMGNKPEVLIDDRALEDWRAEGALRGLTLQ